MRRFLTLTLTILVLLCVVAGCTGSTFFEQYFNTYSSTDAYTQAEESLNLPAGVKIGEYFGNGMFSIQKQIGDVTSFGIATKDYVILPPETSESGYYEYVVDVNDNYAIMVKRMLVDGTLVARLGAIYLAGANRSTDVIGFNYYVSTDYEKLVENQCTIRLVGDYIAVIGDVESNLSSPVDTEAKAMAKEYYTFYKYNEENGVLEEQFRIKASATDSTITQVTIDTVFDEVDGYVVRTDDYNDTYSAAFSIYYYRVRDVDDEGYIDFCYKYQPYSTDSVKTLWESSKTDVCYYEIATYYLGNGIFLQKGAFYSNESFTNYRMYVSDSESPLSVPSYAVMKSDRVNLTGNSPKTYANNNVFPYEVVNQYNDKEMRSLIDSYNSIPYILGEGETETGELFENPIYQYPFYATSSIVSNGYSIVYTHYFPDVSSPEATEDEKKVAPVSYILYNNNDLKEVVLIDPTLMPVVFIDGVGLETYSIDFDQTTDFTTDLFDLECNSTDLQQTVITETEWKQYRAYVYHQGYVIGGELDVNDDSQQDFKKGAFRYDGETLEQVIPYKYDELTPFFGDYAMAAIWDVANKSKTFYRVDGEGKETRVSNVYALYDGCYVTYLQQENGSNLFALWANDGTSLIPYEGVTSIKVLQEYLTADGQFVNTTVIVTIDNHDILYRLK